MSRKQKLRAAPRYAEFYYKMKVAVEEKPPADVVYQLLGRVKAELRNIETEDAAQLALCRIKPRNDAPLNTPVILVHGSYSSRRFWGSDKGQGLGVFLADQGFDVWIPELRGHGQSPKGADFSRITAEAQIRYDLPAIQAAVFAATAKPAFWIGHSFGGLFILASLSMGWLDQDKVRSVVSFGSQITHGDRYLKFPPLAWALTAALRMSGRFPAPWLGLGPEPEAAGTMIEIIGWKKFRGQWRTSDGRSYWDGLADITVPVMTYAAADDKNDPPAGCRKIHKLLGSADKMFMTLGRDTGFSKDYDHVGMVVSKAAQKEVWPDLVGWLKDRI